MIRYSALHVGRSVAVLSLMLAAAQSPVAASRSYLGMTLPYPREIPTFSSQATAPYLLHERLVPAVLVIDTAGQVIGVSSETESDSVFVQYTETWLKGVSFEPARFDDGKIAARLPMTLRFRPRIAQPEVSFPMDSAAAVLDPDLYFKFLALNDVQPPRVERFPAYFCDLTPTDTSVSLRYVFLKLELSKTGKVVNVEPIISTFPAFTQQIQSAILWARFSPAAVRGKSAASTCFILISFFPQIHYPTRVWRPSDQNSLYERLRIRLLPDTVGLLTEPIPAELTPEEFTLGSRQALFIDTVNAVVSVDTLGLAAVHRIGTEVRQLRHTVQEIGRRLQFFPALDTRGNRHPFTGLASFVFDGSTKVRVVYHWLAPD